MKWIKKEDLKTTKVPTMYLCGSQERNDWTETVYYSESEIKAK